MLRGNQMLRLTRREEEELMRLTGYVPLGVRSVADLQRYVDYCKRKNADGGPAGPGQKLFARRGTRSLSGVGGIS